MTDKFLRPCSGVPGFVTEFGGTLFSTPQAHRSSHKFSYCIGLILTNFTLGIALPIVYPDLIPPE